VLGGTSCQQQQTATIADMVEPKVTEVDMLAGTCEINIGFMDGIHGGQALYVARNDKVAARLTVRDLQEYSAECLYHTFPGQLVGPLKGDLVVRRLSDVSRPRTLRDRVPRMVVVPVDPENRIVQVGERKIRISENRVPREKFEEWKKKYEEAQLETTD
jgi:hypothetical protein